MPLVLAMGLSLALVLVLPLELIQVLVLALAQSSVSALLKGSKTSSQICTLIIPPGVITATRSLRNNHAGNFYKSQNLVPEEYGNPQRLKGSLSFSMKHCHGDSVSSTTGRKRY
jgi:hypothetical protein